MKPIQIISQDVFDKIRSRFKNLEMGDESGAVTIDPAEARFFDFDFVLEGNNLGRVSISLNDLGSLKIYYSQGITENVDDSAKKLWYRFLKEMRQFAMRRLLRFDTRDISKSNLDKKDFQYLAKKNENQDTLNLSEDKEMTQMNESRWNHRSSKKTSRAVKGKTQVIVRHSRPVDETYPGARSQRKNIKAIFIENSDGERFKYPFIHPAGAFAMAQHIDHGGVPHDPAGKAIMRMSEEIAQLQEFQRHVQRSQLHDDAMGITERACQKMMELKKTIEALGKKHHYENWIAEFNETEDDGLVELDPVTMEDYKSKFTQTNFQEELSKYFPLIHKIMKETDSVDLEDYVKEDDDDKGKYTVYCSQCGGEFKRDKREGFSHCKNHAGMKNYDLDENSRVDDFNQFVEWAEAVEQGKLTDDQIQALRKALEDLSVPLDLDTAFNFFNEFGIEDSDLENKFQQAKELDSSTDPMEVFKVWADENYPELLVALGMSDTDPEEKQSNKPASENDEMQAPPGLMERRSSIIKEVAKIVKQFYNKDNPKVGPFRGEEGILLDIEKKISEKFGEEAASQARQLAEKYIQKLTTEWQQRHSQEVDNGGLARLRELAKIANAEGIGDRGHGGKDFNLNIMSAEEDVKKDEIPAAFRKETNPTNWKVTLGDLEKQRDKPASSSAGLKRRKKELGIDETETQENRINYPEDPDEYERMLTGRRKGLKFGGDGNSEPYDPWDEYERKQSQAIRQYEKDIDVQYSDEEGVSPTGKKYNGTFLVRSTTPQGGENEIRKFNDAHWGAKSIVDTETKKPEKEGDPYQTLVYYVDNHKHGYGKPWADEIAEQSHLDELDTKTLVKYISTAGKTLKDLPPDQADRRNKMVTRAYVTAMNKPDFADELNHYHQNKEKSRNNPMREQSELKRILKLSGLKK